MSFIKGLEFTFIGKSVSCGVINQWWILQTRARANRSMIDESATKNTTGGYEDLELHVGSLFCEQSNDQPKKTTWIPYFIYPRKNQWCKMIWLYR